MRPLTLAALVTGLLAIPPSARAADTAGKAPPPPIDALVAQLGDKNFRVRQAAGKALEGRGEESLPALRRALDAKDEEVRRRAEVLAQKIERSVLLTPKRVTLAVKNRPVDEAVKELARQTGYKLRYQGGAQRRVTLEVENATFWEALEKICRDGHLTPGFDDQQGTIYLYHQDSTSPYTCHAGPFRFVATNFSYNRYINLANIPRNGRDPNNPSDANNLNFGMMIQAEPKSPLLSVGPPRLTRAEDENGISLLPRQNEHAPQFQVHYHEGNGLFRNFQHSTNVAMTKPARDAARAKVIRGKVVVTLLAGSKPDVVIENLAAGKKKLSGNGQSAEIDVEEVAERNGSYQITLRVRKHVRGSDAPDYNWINGVQQRLDVLDDKGRRYTSQGVTNFLDNTPTSVHATYLFAPPGNGPIGKPAKLVFNQWLTLSHELEFEFKDLPLP